MLLTCLHNVGSSPSTTWRVVPVERVKSHQYDVFSERIALAHFLRQL